MISVIWKLSNHHSIDIRIIIIIPPLNELYCHIIYGTIYRYKYMQIYLWRYIYIKKNNNNDDNNITLSHSYTKPLRVLIYKIFTER